MVRSAILTRLLLFTSCNCTQDAFVPIPVNGIFDFIAIKMNRQMNIPACKKNNVFLIVFQLKGKGCEKGRPGLIFIILGANTLVSNLFLMVK